MRKGKLGDINLLCLLRVTKPVSTDMLDSRPSAEAYCVILWNCIAFLKFHCFSSSVLKHGLRVREVWSWYYRTEVLNAGSSLDMVAQSGRDFEGWVNWVGREQWVKAGGQGPGVHKPHYPHLALQLSIHLTGNWLVCDFQRKVGNKEGSWADPHNQHCLLVTDDCALPSQVCVYFKGDSAWVCTQESHQASSLKTNSMMQMKNSEVEILYWDWAYHSFLNSFKKNF